MSSGDHSLFSGTAVSKLLSRCTPPQKVGDLKSGLKSVAEGQMGCMQNASKCMIAIMQDKENTANDISLKVNPCVFTCMAVGCSSWGMKCAINLSFLCQSRAVVQECLQRVQIWNCRSTSLPSVECCTRVKHASTCTISVLMRDYAAVHLQSMGCTGLDPQTQQSRCRDVRMHHCLGTIAVQPADTQALRHRHV